MTTGSRWVKMSPMMIRTIAHSAVNVRKLGITASFTEGKSLLTCANIRMRLQEKLRMMELLKWRLRLSHSTLDYGPTNGQ